MSGGTRQYPLLGVGLAGVLCLLLTSGALAQAKFPVIVECAGSCDSAVSAVEGVGGEVVVVYKNFQALAAKVPAEGRRVLSTLPGVGGVTKDRIVSPPEPSEVVEIPATEIEGVIEGAELAAALEDVPGGYLHNNDLSGASAFHLNGILGSNVLVAVIDSGSANSPAVPSIFGRVIGGENFVPGDPVSSATSTQNGPHGTWVASSMAANVAFVFSNASTFARSVTAHAPASIIPNFPAPGLSLIPMVGTAPAAQIYALKVFSSLGGGSPESRVIAAMDRAITIRRNFNNGQPFAPVSGSGTENDPFVFDAAPIEIVNMSLGGPTLFAGRDLEDQVTLAMLEVGITLVTSAGNNGHTAMTGGSPGTGIGSLTSGAASLTPNERVLRDLQFGFGIGSFFRPANHTQMATFSSRGPTADGRIDPDNSASGFAVFAQSASGGLNVVSGTSFSSPHTAGGAALLREAVPGASAVAIRDALIDSANPGLIPGAGDIDQGSGFVDFPAALALLQSGSGGAQNDDDDDDDDGGPSSRVKSNLRSAGIKTVRFKGGTFSTRIEDLVPGQVAHFFVESRSDTDGLTVSLDNIDPALPPSQQNLFFGDDIFLQVVDAPTSFDDLLVSGFFSSPVSLQIDNPQTGIVRLAVMGDWTNAGSISTDLVIEEQRSSQGGATASGSVAQSEVDIVSVEIPAGASQAVFELSWDADWGSYPTDDLDMVLIDPASNTSFAGATISTPERVVVAAPAAGTWTAEIEGFTVHDGLGGDDDDDGGSASAWELRVTVDGERLGGGDDDDD